MNFLKTSWFLLGPRVEVGLAPNIMKSISIFPFLIIGFVFFFLLTSKLDVQCMVIAQRNKHNFVSKPFKIDVQ